MKDLNKKALLRAAKQLRKFYVGTISEYHLKSLAQVIEEVVMEESGDDVPLANKS
jgi:hypothetical protein